MLMVDGSSSVLWVANYLMMSIGWAGQKKIGKIRQQSSFTFVFFLFLTLKQKQWKQQQQVSQARKESGVTCAKLFPCRMLVDFRRMHNSPTTLLDAILLARILFQVSDLGGGHNTQSNH